MGADQRRPRRGARDAPSRSGPFASDRTPSRAAGGIPPGGRYPTAVDRLAKPRELALHLVGLDVGPPRARDSVSHLRHPPVHDREGPCSQASSSAPGDVCAASTSAGARAGRFRRSVGVHRRGQAEGPFLRLRPAHSDASYVRAYPAAVNHWGNSTPASSLAPYAPSSCPIACSSPDDFLGQAGSS